MSYPSASGALPPHLDPRRKHHGGRPWRSSVGRVSMAVATFISLAALVVSGYAWYQFRDLNSHITRVQLGGGAGASDTPSQDIDGTDQNILLVGNDDRSKMTDQEVHDLHLGRDGGSMATDTMMIMHIPANGKKATLISLPRDSYVDIPGHDKNRLNAAYSDGYNDAGGSASVAQRQAAGAQLLRRSVQNLTGLTINHYVQISLLGFYEISKAIGGIDVDMCHPVDDTHAHNVEEGQDGGSGLKVPAGKQHLSAEQTLQFVRQRHNLNNGDLDRVKRQQYFLTAAFRKVAGVGLIRELNSLKSAIERNVILDSSLNLFDLANQMSALSANNIVGRTIPIEGNNPDSPVGDVETVDPAQVQRFVTNLIHPPAPRTPPSSASRSSAPSTSRSTAAPAIDSKCIN